MADMMFKLYLSKEVSDWDTDEGPSDKRRLILDESATVHGGEKEIADWVGQWGVDLKDYRVWPRDEWNETLGARFSADQIEDDDGNPSKRGTYLADYDLYIKAYEMTEVDPPTFGLEEVG